MTTRNVKVIYRIDGLPDYVGESSFEVSPNSMIEDVGTLVAESLKDAADSAVAVMIPDFAKLSQIAKLL